jgi:putative transposase
MRNYQSLSHVRWECKYHIVWVPKYRRKKLYGNIRISFGKIIRELCKQKGIEILEGHAMSDHVHICLSIPPKYSVSHVVGFLKGKSAIRIHREYFRHMKDGKSFWARGYFVSTVGLYETTIRNYIRKQDQTDKRQMEFDFNID